MWLVLLGCGSTASIPLAEAPGNRAGTLELLTGVVALDRMGAYDRGCDGAGQVPKGGSPCKEHHFHVAPVTEAEGDVAAWVTCPSAVVTVDACREHLRERTAAGVRGRVMWRYRPNDTAGWGKAIAASGATSVVRAPVILVE